MKFKSYTKAGVAFDTSSKPKKNENVPKKNDQNAKSVTIHPQLKYNYNMMDRKIEIVGEELDNIEKILEPLWRYQFGKKHGGRN
jgi:5'-3' exonuclease